MDKRISKINEQVIVKDTGASVETLCRVLQTMHDRFQVGAVEREVLLAAIEKIHHLLSRAEAAEQERDDKAQMYMRAESENTSLREALTAARWTGQLQE